GSVLGRERRGGERPFDSNFRIVPPDRAIELLPPHLGAFVDDFGALARHAESVGEPGWDPELPAVLRRQVVTDPAAEGGGPAADIDGNVEDRSGDASQELSLRVGL